MCGWIWGFVKRLEHMDRVVKWNACVLLKVHGCNNFCLQYCTKFQIQRECIEDLRLGKWSNETRKILIKLMK